MTRGDAVNPLDAPDPIALLRELLERAAAAEGTPDVPMALATADATGAPSVRIVLLKGLDARGFVFFTNHGSQKARELDDNPRAALCFFWPSLVTQARAQGSVQRLDAAESDAYFATRPRDSQLAAWASRQSAPIASREELITRYEAVAARFAGGPVPRPAFWGGYRLRPDRIEFWTGDVARLHHRTCFIRSASSWEATILQP
jgi:pyridoxamine 5'-phosphate oxidase